MVFFNEAEQLPSRAILNNEYNVFVSLESILYVNDKGMLCLCHDVPLIHNNILFLILKDHILLYHFHRIEIIVNFRFA